ncbi:MAG: hypothetical protein QW507_02265 [Candidatus Nanoarchaeia archaeon]|nr:hypothetical protein [Candidatus Haiyanarchaeum thermophilum]MCW1303243.1 hypothetical protein [Candidatus Haiyanarchaeum thermophilum]MCW1304025.1 hypothetical protein [Candidatus Haiyanarchaeum thermophilum]MCW1306403.1 hypothetical protein [Candidatus Haiyanarchaeum thermophilum]MCW1307299.1 hypothetical protein [Candidatus Haiyanarchaeum thermophilum]
MLGSVKKSGKRPRNNLKVCPNCGSKDVELKGSDIYCKKCGLVISKLMFSEE